jgi:pimeloyl-ACP methyl ester carboxylesterase
VHKLRCLSELHRETRGDGTPAVFVHGSFRGGLDTFRDQLALADEFRVIVVDRRGFGGNPNAAIDGWPTDAEDLVALLEEVGPAHIVGHSYGAVVALLAAARVPERLLSLVAIEPPAFELAHGDAAADATTTAMKPAYERAHELSTSEFVQEWGRTRGMSRERIDAWIASLGVKGWAAAEATRRERWPGDAPIRLDLLAEAAFPMVVVSGGYHGHTRGGRDFAAVCRRLADGTAGRFVVFERSTHTPQIEEPEAFNRLLRELWRP